MAKKPVVKGPNKKVKVNEASDKHSSSEEFFSRILHRAWLRDRDNVYTGEALALALLLHAKGNSKRSKEDLAQVGKMLNDPNLGK